MLPITTQESKEAPVVGPDESIVEPSAVRRSCASMETASRLTWRQLSFDLRNVTLLEAEGAQVFSAACAQTGATPVAGTLPSLNVVEAVLRDGGHLLDAYRGRAEMTVNTIPPQKGSSHRTL
jgi:hypothetical protein